MKKNFFTGFALILPTVITFLIVKFFVNLLTKPFIGLVKLVLAHNGMIENHPALLTLFSQILILLLLFGLTLFIGFIGGHYLVSLAIKMADHLVHQIPIVNRIYKSAKDVVDSLFSSSSPSFSRVVLVPFPSKDTMAIGLITRDTLPELSCQQNELVSVFVPGTPNPTMGFMLSFRQDEIIATNIPVEKAIKFVVSCGVIYEQNPL